MNRLNTNKNKIALQLIALTVGVLLVVIAIFFISPSNDQSDTMPARPLPLPEDNSQDFESTSDEYTSHRRYDSGNSDEARIIIEHTDENSPSDEEIEYMLRNKMIKGDQIVDQPDTNN